MGFSRLSASVSGLLDELRILDEYHPEDAGELAGDRDDALLFALAPVKHQVEVLLGLLEPNSPPELLIRERLPLYHQTMQ